LNWKNAAISSHHDRHSSQAQGPASQILP
jgi:hypothetical protein